VQSGLISPQLRALGGQNPENPSLEWVDDETNEKTIYYGDPIEFIPDSIHDFYRKYKYDRNGIPYESELARYIFAMNVFESELNKCLKISKRV